jgi:hypothetical protein
MEGSTCASAHHALAPVTWILHKCSVTSPLSLDPRHTSPNYNWAENVFRNLELRRYHTSLMWPCSYGGGHPLEVRSGVQTSIRKQRSLLGFSGLIMGPTIRSPQLWYPTCIHYSHKTIEDEAWLSSQRSTLERASVMRKALAAPAENVLPSVQKKVREKEMEPKVLRRSSWWSYFGENCETGG